jgi:hypothetical protein
MFALSYLWGFIGWMAMVGLFFPLPTPLFFLDVLSVEKQDNPFKTRMNPFRGVTLFFALCLSVG